MPDFADRPEGYGLLTRTLHWGMAVLFAAQFTSAAARWAFEREHPVRELLWSYHATLGTTLFLLVMVRGLWGLANISRRPDHPGALGRTAVAGHLAIYALMVLVPATRLLAAAGGKNGFSYLGVQVFAPREAEVAWMRAAAEWHGEMGWLLGALVLGHIAMATIWHRSIRRDDVLGRMAG